MRPLRVRTNRTVALLAMGFCAVSCGRIGFDLMPSGTQRAVLADGGDGSGGARADAASGGSPSSGGTPTAGAGGVGQSGSSGAIGSGGVIATGGAGGNSGTDASAGTGGTPSGGTSSGGASTVDASTGGASTGGTSAGPDAAPPPVCANVTGSVKVWSFDTNVESWQFWPNAGVGVGTLSWTAAAGNPTNGALAIDLQSGNGKLGWIVLDAAAPNLSGQTGTAWVWLDAPASTGVKMYAQSGATTYAWADGGFVALSPRTWTCLTLNFDGPVYKDATFDPTQVVRFGIEISGTGPFTLYVDQLSY